MNIIDKIKAVASKLVKLGQGGQGTESMPTPDMSPEQGHGQSLEDTTVELGQTPKDIAEAKEKKRENIKDEDEKPSVVVKGEDEEGKYDAMVQYIIELVKSNKMDVDSAIDSAKDAFASKKADGKSRIEAQLASYRKAKKRGAWKPGYAELEPDEVERAVDKLSNEYFGAIDEDGFTEAQIEDVLDYYNYDVSAENINLIKEGLLNRGYKAVSSSWKRFVAELKKEAYIKHCPGHKNSNGETAEWCIYSHETGKMLSSHKSKDQAKKHLQDMHVHGSEKIKKVWSGLDMAKAVERHYAQGVVDAAYQFGHLTNDEKDVMYKEWLGVG